MCTDSLHVKSRFATDKEDLVVRLDNTQRYVGLYPTAESGGDQTAMVCFISQKKAIMDVAFSSHVAPHPTRKAWEGKTNVEVTLIGRRYDHLIVEFPDGMREYMAHCLGSRVRVGMPVITGKDGMQAVEKALDEQAKLPAAPEAVYAK